MSVCTCVFVCVCVRVCGGGILNERSINVQENSDSKVSREAFVLGDE